MREFDTYLDLDPKPQWQCPCPECNGWTPGPPEEDEDSALAACEPHPDEMEPSEWVWAE